MGLNADRRSAQGSESSEGKSWFSSTLRPRHPASGFQCDPQASPCEFLRGGRGTLQAGRSVAESDTALTASGSEKTKPFAASKLNPNFLLMALLKAR